jgi:ABC-2 type transport system ATP-binding protein
VNAVRASGVAKRFGTTTALYAVDLDVAPGEVRGLLGPNGAGKTTLLRILFGLIRADAGSVELMGRAFEPGGGPALDGVAGFVEEPSFYPYLSGAGNLAVFAKLDKRGDVGPAEIDEALRRVDLLGRRDDRLSGYSTGMRQRLGIAAALLRSPQLLLLDEPTSGLDPAGTRAVAALVRELSAAGVAVLLSSHQIGELEKVCHSYTFLREGNVVWSGSASELEVAAPASAYALATGDDGRALQIAAAARGVRAGRSPRGDLAIVIEQPEAFDPLMLALADARLVIRRLEQQVSPLESMFFALTEDDALEGLAPHEVAERIRAERISD